MTSHAPQIFLISTTRTCNLRSPHTRSCPCPPFAERVLRACTLIYAYNVPTLWTVAQELLDRRILFLLPSFRLSLSMVSRSRSLHTFPAWFGLALKSWLPTRNTHTCVISCTIGSARTRYSLISDSERNSKFLRSTFTRLAFLDLTFC